MRLVGVALLLVPASAAAGGVFLAPVGLRALGRGGAFVAGSEGPLALAYNPAGLASGDAAAMLDLTVPHFTSEFSRRVGATEQQAVRGRPVTPLAPSLLLAHGLGVDERLFVGGGFVTEPPAVQNWPAGAAQRYSLHHFRGSALSKLGVGLACRALDWLTLGASLHAMAGRLSAEGTFSVCDGVICTRPEDPDYDAVARITTGTLFAPGWQVGLIATPLPSLRIGLAYESGYHLHDDEAHVALRLPSAAAFDEATIEPAEPVVAVAARLPDRARAGVELRVGPARAEASVAWEGWSGHDRIRIDARRITARNVTGIGDYAGSEVIIERGLRDTWSVRAGAELALETATVRLGVGWDPSATPDETLSPLTVDLDKLLLGGGAGAQLGDVRLDVAYVYIAMKERQVATSTTRQVNPGRPPFTGTTVIGNGRYSGRAHLVGVAASYLF